VSVREDAAEGSEILRLLATDLDGSAPNNDVVYRITSGAKDKFVVDPDTGKSAVFLNIWIQFFYKFAIFSWL
jgi:cadherin 23